MAREKRICKTCKRQIKRGEHWRMVALTWLEKHIDKLRGKPVVDEKPQHWNCQHRTQDNPAKWFKLMEKRARLDGIVDMVRDEASPTEKEFENV